MVTVPQSRGSQTSSSSVDPELSSFMPSLLVHKCLIQVWRLMKVLLVRSPHADVLAVPIYTIK